MSCSVSIDHVNLLPSTTPQRLRVMGRAPGCLKVTLTTNPAATASATTNPDALGHYAFEVDLTQPFACGAANFPNVIVSCSAKYDPTDVCADAQWSGTQLPCCEGQIVTVVGFASQGSVSPTHIDVGGTCYGCSSNQLTISIDRISPGGTTALITPTLVNIDPITGSFTARFPINSNVSAHCADEIRVTATCSAGTCTIAPFRGQLACPQCFRADLSVSVAPCSDPSDPTTTVTLTTNIGLPKGDVRVFSLDFGNGQPPCTFTIDNSAGGDDAVYQQICTSTYATGLQYTATLRIPALGECPQVTKIFYVDCGGCPNATASVFVGNCVTPGPGVNPLLVGARPVTMTVDVPAGVPANLKTTANFSYGGTDLATGNHHSVTPLPNRLGAGPLSETIYLGAPGSYLPTVTLTFLQGSQLFCPPQPALDLTTRPPGQTPGVDLLGCIECPVKVLLSKSQNPPTQPHWKLGATVDWGTAPLPHPPVIYYDWTITAPNGTDQATAQTRIAAGQTSAADTITTEDGQGWTGSLATVNGGVNLAQGGTYDVGISAHFSHSSGLPLDGETGEVSCRTTGSGDFAVAGPPPGNCQTLTGLSAPIIPCADPAQSLSSTVDFVAVGTNLGSGPYQWDFGDPGSGTANTSTTTLPTAQHVYSAPGSYPVKVTIPSVGNCPQTESLTGVTIATCPCPPGQTRLSNGSCGSGGGGGPGGPEGLGCLILRWVAVALVAFGIITSLILACMWSQLSNLWQGVMLGVGIGSTVIGIILFAIWAIICPTKPCLWGWLLAGQVALGVALGCVYFLPLWPWHVACCFWIFLVGFSVFGTLAAIFLLIWIYRCMPTLCQVMIELVPIIADVILVIAWIALLQDVRDCIDPLGTALVAALSSAGVFFLAGCAASGGVTTKTGAPAR